MAVYNSEYSVFVDVDPFLTDLKFAISSS